MTKRIDVPISAEWRLLLRACAIAPQTIGSTRCLPQNFDDGSVDWNQFVDRASEHDIGPLVYRVLQRCELRDDRALNDLARLKAQYCATAVRNVLIVGELESVLRALDARRKRVVVLKGAALAATVYGNLPVRPMQDVDLLIRKDDLPDIERLLESFGYTLNDSQRRVKSWYLAHHYHLTFHRRVSSGFTMHCEIHWDLERPGRPFAVDIDGVWARAHSATVAGVTARVLSPEDLLLHLCLHACKHRLIGGFRAFCDIAAVARHHSLHIDWEQIRLRALEWRISSFVYVPLRLAHEFLAAEIPPPVLNSLVPGCDDSLVNLAAAAVLENRVSASLFEPFFGLRYGHTIAQRAGVLRRVFSRDAIAARYGLARDSRKIYRYYPQRLKDVTLDYGPHLWQFVRDGRRTISQAERRLQLAEWLAPFRNDEDPVQAVAHGRS
jgi:hypothetical protein